MPSHGLNASQPAFQMRPVQICFNALARAKCICHHRLIKYPVLVSMPSHGLNASANLHKRLSFPLLLSLYIPTIPQNSPSVNHFSPNSTILFPVSLTSHWCEPPHFRPPTAASATQISKKSTHFPLVRIVLSLYPPTYFFEKFRILPLTALQKSLTHFPQ